MVHYKTTSLDPRELPFNEDKLRKYTTIISDIDLTLIDNSNGHKEGVKALAQMFNEQFANQFDRIYYLILTGNRLPKTAEWKDRGEFNSTLEEFSNIEKSFIKEYGVKVWSREVWIILSAKKVRLTINKKQIVEGRDLYWQKRLEHATIYPDAKIFLNILKKLNIHLLLMSASDSLMVIKDDCSVVYDPKFSAEYKQRRIEAFLPGYNTVLGDPIDKPSMEYFQNIIKEIKKIGNFDNTKILFMGDSQRNDLEIPQQLGFDTLLVKRY